MNSLNGYLLIDKPKGMTSHDVINRIRKIFGIKKVGHTGTLDPNATGVLVIGVGEATKFIKFLPESTKTYEAEIIFGKKTDTDDITGTLIQNSPLPNLNTDSLGIILKEFLGEQEQIPPIYSAKKVDGKKLYQYAREGKDITLKPSKICIDSIELIETDDFPNRLKVRIKCSPGTYIRSFARDLGQRLNSSACLGELRRIQSGNLEIDNSVRLEELEDSQNLTEFLLPIPEAIKIPKIYIKNEFESALKNGSRLDNSQIENDVEIKEGDYVKLFVDDRFYGIGIVNLTPEGEYSIQPKRMLDLNS